MVEPLRHRQTKEAATDMFCLKPPRHISTLHFADKPTAPGFVAYWTNNGQRWISARVGCDAIDPNVWSGRALQVDFAELAVSGLASMYPASDWSVLCSGPSWISARVRSH